MQIKPVEYAFLHQGANDRLMADCAVHVATYFAATGTRFTWTKPDSFERFEYAVEKFVAEACICAECLASKRAVCRVQCALAHATPITLFVRGK